MVWAKNNVCTIVTALLLFCSHSQVLLMNARCWRYLISHLTCEQINKKPTCKMKMKKYRWNDMSKHFINCSEFNVFISVKEYTCITYSKMLHEKWPSASCKCVTICVCAHSIFDRPSHATLLGGLFCFWSWLTCNPRQSWFSCHYYQCSGHMILF